MHPSFTTSTLWGPGPPRLRLLSPSPLPAPGLCPLDLSRHCPFWEQALYGSHPRIFTHAASCTGNDLLYQSQLIVHFSSTWSQSTFSGEERGFWSPASRFRIEALPPNGLGNFLKLSLLRFALILGNYHIFCTIRYTFPKNLGGKGRCVL